VGKTNDAIEWLGVQYAYGFADLDTNAATGAVASLVRREASALWTTLRVICRVLSVLVCHCQACISSITLWGSSGELQECAPFIPLQSLIHSWIPLLQTFDAPLDTAAAQGAEVCRGSPQQTRSKSTLGLEPGKYQEERDIMRALFCLLAARQSGEATE
jgi:hypothetical protein